MTVEYRTTNDSERDCARVGIQFRWAGETAWRDGPCCALNLATCFRELREQYGLADDTEFVEIR